MSFINDILTAFGIGTNNSGPSGASAIVLDYNERHMMEEQGSETTGFLVRAERLVEQGVFQSSAVAQLWFDLGKYGEYPITLDLPDGPMEESELDQFMAHLGREVHELEDLVIDQAVFPFVRVGGEWKIDWETIESDVDDIEIDV